MSAAWLAYVVVVSLLAGAVAACAETLAHAYRRQARLVWVAAMVVSVGAAGWPLVAPPSSSGTELAPGAADDVPPGEPESVGVLEPALGEAGRTPSPLAVRLPRWGAVWGSLSAGLLLLTILPARRTLRRARRWPVTRVAGHDVLRSDDLGPAVVGLLRPRIVVPGWAFDELTAHELEMAVRHEAEHARAGDLPLLALGGALVVLVPWNPALWWQLRRLVRAVELDCDARVLRRGTDPADYGRLLLDVAGRAPSSSLLPGPALGRPSFLRERVGRLTGSGVGRRGTVGALAGALLAAVAACEVPVPTTPLDPSGGAKLDVSSLATASGRLLDRGAFRADVAALSRDPRSAEATGVVALGLDPATDGRVERVRVDGTSGPSVTVATVALATELARGTKVVRDDPDAGGWVPLWVVFHRDVVEAHLVHPGLYAEKDFLRDRESLARHMEVVRTLSPLRFGISDAMAAADRPGRPGAPPSVSIFEGAGR